MRQYKSILWVAIIGIMVVTISGCSFTKKVNKATTQIDPPQTSADVQINLDAAANKQLSASDQVNATLYFKDQQGKVAPISMNIPKVDGIGKEALQYMVQGGPETSMLPQGFTALLPKGTIIKGINVVADQKLAIVNFSKQFATYAAQDERKILEAVTWTLTGFPSVDKVQIWEDGKILKQMPVNGTPIQSPLTRAMGINIERQAGVDFGQSTPVTLYFLNQTSDNFRYYVPVTRMIQRTDNKVLAAMQQLIQGPQGQDGLSSVINPDVKVISVTDSNGLISVNLDDKLLGVDNKAPAEAVQSIVLSLTENTGASKVQIMVNGDAKTSSGKSGYSQLVSRPVHVNEIKI